MTYEVYNIRDDDEGEMWNKKLLYIGDFISSKNFVKKKYHMFNDNYESHLTYEKHYDMILDDDKIFTEWKYI